MSRKGKIFNVKERKNTERKGKERHMRERNVM